MSNVDKIKHKHAHAVYNMPGEDLIIEAAIGYGWTDIKVEKGIPTGIAPHQEHPFRREEIPSYYRKTGAAMDLIDSLIFGDPDFGLGMVFIGSQEDPRWECNMYYNSIASICGCCGNKSDLRVSMSSTFLSEALCLAYVAYIRIKATLKF